MAQPLNAEEKQIIDPTVASASAMMTETMTTTALHQSLDLKHLPSNSSFSN